jgi:hypothetical protein
MLVSDNTLAEIGDVFGLTRERVRQILNERDVTTRRGRRSRDAVQAAEERDAEIRRLAGDHTQAEVMQLLGVSRATVQRAAGTGLFRGSTKWTQELVIQGIQEYAKKYGRPPTSVAWNVAMARREGRQDLVDRFYADGCWPHISTIQRFFPKWNDAIKAAGFEPLRPGERR